MSSIIQLLPDHVANQIAAGEVVQRPASVVKELLENAVDAKATDIKLIVKDAGKTLVQVIDNGIGMSVTDARLCFERHATSKIRHAEDLFAIHTKGFRGEALASIASIAHVELKTRQEQDELGTHIIIDGSKFIAQDPAVLPKGTSFAVKNLFFNIPARRNFLKSDHVEFRHVMDEFHRVALAHPNIHFTLIHNGSEMFNLPSSNYRQRIVAIFAGKTNEKLVPVTEETDLLSIQGFVGKPEFAKKNKGEQFFFVNDRFIRSSYLHHAVLAAYEGLMREGMQPSYFLYLQVPTHSIDINIHPTKTEIKFDDEQALYAILRSAVKHSLGQFNVAPILDFERDPNLDTPYDYQNKTAGTPAIEVDRNYNPFAAEAPKQRGTDRTTLGSGGYVGHHFSKPAASPTWESLYVGLKHEAEAFDNAMTQVAPEVEIAPSLFNSQETESTTQKTYQLQRKYVVSPIKSGLMLIDQNRAHQRILYEQYLTNMTVHKAASQQLLFPLPLHFNPVELHLLHELQDGLQTVGFSFDRWDSDCVFVSGIPITTSESTIVQLLEEIVHAFQEGLSDSYSQNDTLAKSMARSLAVKNGACLSDKEMDALVNNLFACKEPNISPFQKPTFITLSMDEIDKKFNL
ncbi:DNA mismatch repair endonuclease MutL [Flavobacterium sp.]|uniref:DNA mismatch repair endonuclease MutL n=1 Tax=Flavobacterium sp. TaxID=239 RepID=UPI00262A045D|nr:DNA mismatch repair endonuclease MutL [Flavobacterium sp.]